MVAREMEIFFIKHSVCYIFHIKKEFMYLHHILYLQSPSVKEIQGTEHVNIAYLFCLKSASLAYIPSAISLSKPIWLCTVSYKQFGVMSVAPVEL